jgi:hypothetical protein
MLSINIHKNLLCGTQNYITTAGKKIDYIIKNRATWATDYDFTINISS